MTQLTDNLFAVEVPEKVKNLNLYRINGHAIMLEWDDIERPLNPFTCVRVDEYFGNLIDYKWPKFICTTREAKDEQAAQLVQPLGCGFITVYKNYRQNITGGDFHFSALESLCSLITSKGLDITKNYVLLKKDLI